MRINFLYLEILFFMDSFDYCRGFGRWVKVTRAEAEAERCLGAEPGRDGSMGCAC